MPEWLSALPRPGGSYDIWHEGPAIKLTEDSRIKDGDVLSSSRSSIPTSSTATRCAALIEDPKVFDIFDEQMKWMKKLWDAPAYVLGYDEIRAGGWEKQPGGATLTPAQLLANHISRAYGIVKKYSPDAAVYTWSDMFDPYHNARHNARAAPTISSTATGTVRGRGCPRRCALSSGAAQGRRHPLLHRARQQGRSSPATRARGRPVAPGRQRHPGVLGFMYTTWSKDYSRRWKNTRRR